MMELRWLLLGVMVLAAAPCPAAEQALPARDQPHQQLDQILRRPMYQRWQLRQKGQAMDADSPMLAAYRERMQAIGRKIGEWLERLFRRNRPSGSPSGGGGAFLPVLLRALAWTALALAVVFLGILLFKLVRSADRAGPAARVLSREQIHQAMRAGDALAMDSAQWVGEAMRLAAENDFRSVYRALYLALLSGLHTAGKIDFNRNHTNWIYVQRFRGTDDHRAQFSELTGLFDRVWYGERIAHGLDLNRLHRQVAELTAKEGRP